MNPDDQRSQLVWSFLDAVEKVKPKVFVMENVAALGTLEKWGTVRAGIISRGQKLGYAVDYKVHHTSDYGVPENRDRVIFIGIRRDVGLPVNFYERLSMHSSLPVTAREAILSAGEYGSEENPQTCTAHISLAACPVMRKSPFAGMLVNGAGRPIDLDGVAPTLPASTKSDKGTVLLSAFCRKLTKEPSPCHLLP